ncbi:MAG: hypothetical protein ACI8RZ_006017 [Myxococcota bacterium]|jgi:hypothetical protein
MTLLLLALGCSGPSAVETAGGVNDTGPAADTNSPAQEVCDGVDNNGDGLIDEVFEDVDGDGVVDCLQCDLEGVSAGVVSDVPNCHYAGKAAEDLWDMEVLWEFTPPGATEDGDAGCLVRAAADLDGDGGADLLCLSLFDLYAISGADGSVLWQQSSISSNAPVAVGDIDQDGSVDVATVSQTGSLFVFERDGSMKWAYSDFMARGGSKASGSATHLEIHDLDGDGDVEAVNHQNIVNSMGTFEHTVAAIDGNGFSNFIVEDINRDGARELLYRSTVYSSSGEYVSDSLEFFVDDEDHILELPLPVPVQADADENAEVFWLEYRGDIRRILLIDDDNTLLAEIDTDGYAPTSFSCAGDTDGDGLMELFNVQDQSPGRLPQAVAAYDVTGTMRWRFELKKLEEELGFGCTVFDFDLNDRPEILLMSNDAIYVLDSLDGSILVELRHQSRQNHSPFVVDVDGDGSADIVVPYTTISTAPQGTPGLRIYSHREQGWPPGTGIWANENWSGTGMYSNGEVGPVGEAPWLTTGLFRGQPSWKLEGADLRPVVVESCASTSEHGEVKVSVAVENLGPQTALPGTTLNVYALDEAGGKALVASHALTERLAAGEVSPSVEVAFASREALGAGLSVVVGEAAGVGDCDPANNAVGWGL